MSLLRRLRDERAVSFQDVWGRGLDWGGRRSTAGETVNQDTALGLTATWRCVSLLADSVSALPMDAFRMDGDIRRQVTPAPAVVAKPSLVMSRREWVYQAMVSLLLWGNAYGLVVARDAMGRPATIEWLDPAAVRVEAATFLRRPAYWVSETPVAAEDVVHLRAFVRPGSVVGLAPLEVHRETFGLALAVRKFGAQWFGNGAHPSGVLESEKPVDEATAKLVKARFKQAAKNREPVAMGAGVKYKQVQVAPNESQFGETAQALIGDVARVFGVPVEFIGGSAGGGSVTYANREQRSLDLLTFGVQPWLARLEDAVTDLLPRPQFVKFNPGALLRTDLKTRYEAHQLALRNHFLTIGEVRALEDREPLDNGEDFPPVPGQPDNEPAPRREDP